MTKDQLLIVLIDGAWSLGTVLLGLLLAWAALRRRSFRSQLAALTLIAVAAVLAAMLGTAQAMFLSEHDFSVILLVAVVSGAVATVGALVAGSTLSRWSARLTNEAKRFGEAGAFTGAAIGSSDLRELADELARTSAKLQESRAREAKLEESRRELVSWVSHDLRTPLAGMRAMAEALEDGMAEDPNRYHRQIRTEVDRMVLMVDDLFALSRIHAGSLRLNLEPVVLGDVISEALASADPVAKARDVHLGGMVAPGLEVVADPAELSRVVSNLLMNAIRHTPAGGQVQVSGRSASGGVELAVVDGCGGLTEDEMARVFDVAWQGSSARTPETNTTFGSGAGLGLAIVQGIVEAHGGSVVVANRTPGCEFLVRLPSAGALTTR